ncbi:MAG: CAP domain-containing protein [Syntrophobacteraceae bacterium]
MSFSMKRIAVALFLFFSLQAVSSMSLHAENTASDNRSPTKTTNAENSRDKTGADSNDSFYSMSPSEFFEMAEVGEKIDLQKIDHGLLSASIFQETVRQRQKHDRDPLENLPRLDEASRMHARDMAEHDYVAHENPREKELRTPLDRVQEVGLKGIRFVAENVASEFGIRYEEGKAVLPMEKNGDTEYYYKPGGKPIENHTYRSFAESLVDAWMNSPGHRKNILSEKPEFLGAGCSMGDEEKGLVKFYCVQLFFDRFG